MSQQRKTVIVTGASGGLGQAIAKAFADRGDNIVLAGTNAARLAATQDALGAPENAITAVTDIARAEDRARLVAAALSRFGRIDVLVNNAGIFEPRPFLEVDEAHLELFLAVNLKGSFFLTQAVVPHLQRGGGGAVINIGTVLVDHAIAGLPITAPMASKGALHTLTRQLAAELGGDNIRVNTISPGIIRTPLHGKNGITDADSLAGLHLLNRIGEPDDIARTALLLADSDFITGATVNVDGGHVAGHGMG